MENSLVTHLKEYSLAMFKDIAWLYSSQSDWRRDQSRLLHELEAHGSRVLTIDLPAIANHLHRCLDEEAFTPSSLYLMSSGAHGYPKFLGILWKRIFDDGKLGKSPDLDAIYALRQVLLSCKKLRLNCTHRRVSNELREFFKIEQELRSSSNSWDEDDVSFASRYVSFADGLDSGDRSLNRDLFSASSDATRLKTGLDILQQVCDRISAQFGDLHSENRCELPKHGPGVVANLLKSESKYDFREWPRKLELTFPYDRYATYDFMSGNLSNGVDGHDAPLNKESPSRLIVVPKTQKAPRLIAAEPNEHQWIQQLVRSQLEGRLAQTSLSKSIFFRDQTFNQRAALRGSVDGSLATVDLSSASDRLTCWTVERAFRKNITILERLHACRTRWVSNGIDNLQPKFLRLKKFAPMGSSVTFPVQTIIYACVAVSALLWVNHRKVNSASIEAYARQVTVFGDDIVIPKAAFECLVALLTHLGLKVNVNKSFAKGFFRESCGVDCMHGVDLTPAYFLNPATSVPLAKANSQLSVVNNFWAKGWWNISKFLETTIRDRHLVPVVGPSPVTPGLVSFCGPCPTKSGWDTKLHQVTYAGLRVSTRVPVRPDLGRHRMSQWFCEKPLPDSDWSSGIRGIPVVSIRPGRVSHDDMFRSTNHLLFHDRH